MKLSPELNNDMQNAYYRDISMDAPLRSELSSDYSAIEEGFERLKETIISWCSNQKKKNDTQKTLLQYADQEIKGIKSFPSDKLIKYARGVIRNKTVDKQDALLAFMIDDDFNVIEQAKERIVSANLLLVVTIARQVYKANTFYPLEDRIQDGNAGLIRAAYRYRASEGACFSTYASFWIRQSIQNAFFHKSRIIRWPAHIYIRAKEIQDAESAGTEVCLKNETKIAIKSTSEAPISLDASFSTQRRDGESEPLINSIEDENSRGPEAECSHRELLRTIDLCMAKLNPREQEIISRRFGLGGRTPQSLDSVRREFGLSRERIRQIQKGAIAKMKKGPAAQTLKRFWE